MKKDNLNFNITTLTASGKKEVGPFEMILEFKKEVQAFKTKLNEWAGTEVAKANSSKFLECSKQVDSLYEILDNMERTERNAPIKTTPIVTKENAAAVKEDVKAPVAPAISTAKKASRYIPYIITDVIPKLSR